MKTERQVIEESVRTNPFLLNTFEDKEKIALSYLPFSVGIETECQFKDSFNAEVFGDITDLITFYKEDEELSFRIPNGLKGLVCLFRVCEYIEEHCLLSASGNHYHIDCTDWIDSLTDNRIEANSKWVLKELESWKYEGNYNSKGFNRVKTGWVCRRKDNKTIEFRIGEMALDYSTITNRIIHASKIVKRLRYICEGSIDTKKLENLLRDKQRQLKEIEEAKKKDLTSQIPINMQDIINNRVVKFKK